MNTGSIPPVSRLLHPDSSLLAFRPAVLADAPLLRRWDEEPHVVASDPNDDCLVHRLERAAWAAGNKPGNPA